MVRAVAARQAQTGNKAHLDRIHSKFEDDRDHGGGRLRRQCAGNASDGGNHAHPAANKIGRQDGEAIILPFCRTIFDHYIAAFDIAGFVKPLAEGRHHPLPRCSPSGPRAGHRAASKLTSGLPARLAGRANAGITAGGETARRWTATNGDPVPLEPPPR